MSNSITVNLKNESGQALYICVNRADGPWLSLSAATPSWVDTFDQSTCVIEVPSGTKAAPGLLTWQFLEYAAEGARMYIGEAKFDGIPNLVLYDKIYDKVEMGWNAIWNLTNVDFFAFPMRIEGNSAKVGYVDGSTRTSLMTAMDGTPAPYKNLKFPTTGTALRYFGPGMYYAGDPKILEDCFGEAILKGLPELAKFTGTFDYGGFVMSDIKTTGSNSISLKVNGTPYTMDNITTITAAGNTIVCSPNNAAGQKAAAVIGAAISRGVLYDPSLWGASGGGNAGYPKKYYQNTPLNGNQWHQYSAVLHDNAIDNLAYGSSFDDIFHQDSSIHFDGGDTVSIIVMPFS
ncbi:MAG: hypothetical protein ACI837_001128 [Crocinitomicaceae bacterium]|jgi:hypothetical protein